mgnify:CR=1 FL=1
MALLDDDIQKQLRQAFEGLTNPVKLVMFSQEDDGLTPGECDMCAETRQLVEEVAALDERIQCEIYDFAKDQEKAQEFHIDKIPAIMVLQGPDFKDNGIRLFGIPSGYEFGTLIQDMLMVSNGKANLSEKTLKEIGKLKEPVHIQVFTTPT